MTGAGRIWASAADGIFEVVPERVVPDFAPPVAEIGSIVCNDETVDIARTAGLGPSPVDMEFSFLGVSLLAPDAVRYRYRLDDVDEDWIEAGTSTSASYAELAPGKYMFRVQARHDDGLWSKEAMVDFTVERRTFERPWLLGLGALGAMAVGFFLSRFKVRHTLAREARLSLLLEQRTRTLAEEVAERRRTEEELRRSRDELFRKFQRRTEELESANKNLRSDMEERRRLERELLQAQKLESVGRLAGGIAHDLNNLLTAILGYSQMLEQDLQSDPRLLGDVQEIRKAGERASKLTNQLLTFARRQVRDPRLVDLNDLTHNISNMLERIIGEDLELETRLDDDLGAVKIDPNQAEQVLVNLVVNARDATPADGRITIETRNVTLPHQEFEKTELAADDYVVLTVHDTGTGIEPDTLPNIFEPFFTTKEAGAGTGLGLSTCYGIVRQAGGHIAVETEVDRGSKFKVLLPRSEQRAPTPVEEPVEPIPNGQGCILVVEDEDAVRGIAVRTLRKLGFDVRQACDGVEALDIYNRHGEEIDAVLTDVVMPNMGGKELARNLRELKPDLKILFASGYPENEISHDGVLDPGIAFLPKPFTPTVLAHRLHALLADD